MGAPPLGGRQVTHRFWLKKGLIERQHSGKVNNTLIIFQTCFLSLQAKKVGNAPRESRTPYRLTLIDFGGTGLPIASIGFFSESRFSDSSISSLASSSRLPVFRFDLDEPICANSKRHFATAWPRPAPAPLAQCHSATCPGTDQAHSNLGDVRRRSWQFLVFVSIVIVN